MGKASLAVGALVTLVAAIFTLSVVQTTRAQTATRIEYLRATPFSAQLSSGALNTAYQACVAGPTEWTCRDFRPTVSSDSALRTMLSTLGNEGWELVSAAGEGEPTWNKKFTYLFK